MTQSIEITKEDFANATKQFGVAQKHYNDVQFDNAYISEDGAVVTFKHLELSITFFEGFETYEVSHHGDIKDCESKSNAKKLVKIIVEKGQLEGESDNDDEELELYRLYKSSK